MLSNWAIKQLQHITLDYMKLECKEGTCYGIIAVCIIINKSKEKNCCFTLG